MRGVTGFGGGIGWFLGVKYLPLGIVNSIYSICNLIASIWARIFLKEPISAINIFTLILSFLGIILINDPFES